MKLFFIIFISAIFFSSFCQWNVGERVCILPGLNLRNAPCGSVVRTSSGSEIGSVTEIKREACSFGTFTWVGIKIDGSTSGPIWGAHETNLLLKCHNIRNSTNFNVPMIHQRWDTADGHDGSWSCGPTSTTMVVSYFGRLEKKPIRISAPTPHMNDFGWYLSNIYTSNQTGQTFNRMEKDPRGKLTGGAYGSCVENGAAWAWRMQRFAEAHGLKTSFFSQSSFALIRQELSRDAIVCLSTMVTSAGHIFVVKGHEGTDTIIVNDPWGNYLERDTYGQKMNGHNIKYPYSRVSPKWMISIWK